METRTDAQSNRLMKVTNFADYPVTVIPHGTLNSSKGIVYCKDLMNCSEEEIQEELKEIGVMKVERIKIRKDGKLTDTPNHILTFNKPKLPSDIKVAMYKLEIRPYIPAPVRCYRCQKLGHTTISCNNEPRCACGKQPHEDSPCESSPVCVNCNGSHSAGYKGCPAYKTEFAIQKIRVTEKLSYFEAKKK